MRGPIIRLFAGLVLAATLSTGCKGEPRVMQVEIAIEGMTCESCVNAITHELGRLEGVRTVKVDLEAEKAVVTFTEDAVALADIEQTIETIGYEAEPGQPTPTDTDAAP